jgi:hypothetical protein
MTHCSELFSGLYISCELIRIIEFYKLVVFPSLGEQNGGGGAFVWAPEWSYCQLTLRISELNLRTWDITFFQLLESAW